MKKVIGVVIGLLPVSVSAQCITPPDCASIGYTETSCEGDSLKCPFDTSKLYCPPCDSSYKYFCTGDNIKNPIGDTCNNKYAACECIAGAIYSNGECICDTSCNTIGNIYYSDGTCSSCNHTDKIPVGIIAYISDTQKLIISFDDVATAWANDQSTNIASIPNKTASQAIVDFGGFDYTQAIVATYGTEVENTAAVYCYNYYPENAHDTQGQWYLPALGALYNVIHVNRDKVNQARALLGKIQLNTSNYYSSSEASQGYAWDMESRSGVYDNGAAPKMHNLTATCVLAIE